MIHGQFQLVKEFSGKQIKPVPFAPRGDCPIGAFPSHVSTRVSFDGFEIRGVAVDQSRVAVEMGTLVPCDEVLVDARFVLAKIADEARAIDPVSTTAAIVLMDDGVLVEVPPIPSVGQVAKPSDGGLPSSDVPRMKANQRPSGNRCTLL